MIILRFFTLLKPHYKQGIIIAFILLFSSITTVLTPFLYKEIIDECLISGNKTYLIYYILSIIALMVLQEILKLYRIYQASNIRRDVFLELRKSLYNHLLRMPQSYYSQKHSGRLLSRITSDVDAVQNLLLEQFIYFVQNLFVSILIIVVIVYMDWRMLIIAFAFLPVLYLLFFFFRTRIVTASKKVQEKQEILMEKLHEDFSLVKMIQAFPSMQERIKLTYEQMHETENARRNLNMNNSTAASSTIIISVIGIVVIWGFGGFEVINGKMSIGSLVAISFFVNYIDDMFYSIYNITTGFFSSVPSAERIFEILDLDTDIKDDADSQEIAVLSGSLSFRNVTFGYSFDKPVLKDANLITNCGEIVGITGISGAGKTTVANLVARFYEPDSGIIELNNQNIKKIKLECLRRNVAIVPQEDYMFNISILDNIVMGRKNITLEQIHKVTVLAELEEFIYSLKDGYETIIGEKGTILSGGQKKRIMIARALIGNPYILIFDEATSNLDEETEKLIFKSIRNISNDRISIFITHKISNLKYADRILTIDDGKIRSYINFSDYLNCLLI